MEVKLDNDVMASFKEEEVDEITKHKTVANGWKPGRAVHFGVSLGFMNAVAEQMPDLVLGKLGETSIIDGKALARDIISSYIEKNELNIVKIAASRSSAVKKLNAVKEAIGDNPALIEALKAQGIEL